MQTLLNTAEDLVWLEEVHGIPATGFVCAILYGNEDAPERVELYVRNDYRCVPVIYDARDNGTFEPRS